MPMEMRNQKAVQRRRPSQARALHKIDLMLEAAMQLIERDGIDALTTNAVAEKAGVSIGTLYQYFDNRQAILTALAQRELEGMTARVIRAVQSDPPPDADLSTAAEVRVRRVVQAVLTAYGGRRRAHRALIERALNAGSETRLAPICAEIFELLLDGDGRQRFPLQPAQAFVVTYAVAGVLRGMVSNDVSAIPHAQIVDELVRLIQSVIDTGTPAGAETVI